MDEKGTAKGIQEIRGLLQDLIVFGGSDLGQKNIEEIMDIDDRLGLILRSLPGQEELRKKPPESWRQAAGRE